MNLYSAIQQAVLAKPGSTAAEVAAAVGISGGTGIKNVSAQLTKLALRNKVMRNPCSKSGRQRYYPSATCGVNLRESGRKTRDALRADARAARAAGGALRPAAQPRIVPRPSQPARPGGGVETIEEFLARGGTVQHLPPHYCANALRFDHSATAAPVGRRPVVRARPAAAAK